MQVQTAPKQADGFNCGVYTGLAAQSFARWASGEFVYHPRRSHRSTGKVECGGPHATFLSRTDLWHTASDVMAWRVLLHAAVGRRWMQDNSADATATERADHTAASQRAADLLNSSGAAADQTWCVLPTRRILPAWLCSEYGGLRRQKMQSDGIPEVRCLLGMDDPGPVPLRRSVRGKPTCT